MIANSYSRHGRGKLVPVRCQHCRGIFGLPANVLRNAKKGKCCSVKCSGKNTRKATGICKGCGKEFTVARRLIKLGNGKTENRKRYQQYCNRECFRTCLDGKTKKVTTVLKSSYGGSHTRIMVKDPSRRKAKGRGGEWVALPRMIAEKVVGRLLEKHEHVHHINCDPEDNRNCNLMVCDMSYHMWLHGEYSKRYGRMMFNKSALP